MAFCENIVQKVLEKATIVVNYDPNMWRKDHCGAWIGRDHYGNRGSEYGWEIDYIKPLSKGGGNILSNLRPLHWKKQCVTPR